MKNKHGFTLAEVLLTLGIIGVVAALTLPAANSLMPDETKVMYLKTFDTISETMKSLASNTRLFPVCRASDNVSCAEHPFLNTDKPMDEQYKDYEGDTKLCDLFALSMGVEDAECSSGVSMAGTYYPENLDNTFNRNIDFITQNGMKWHMRNNIYANLVIRRYLTEIYVDINGDKIPNCFYNSDSCTKPDRFKFFVYSDGGIEPADPIGVYYINNRTSLTRKNFEIENTAYPTADSTREAYTKEYCIDTNGVYQCPNCDYQYIPSEHSNTPFSSLWSGYTCPWCGTPKSSFKKL